MAGAPGKPVEHDGGVFEDEDLAMLEELCKSEEKQIQVLQTKLNEVSTSTIATDNVSFSVLRDKRFKLLAELGELKSSSPEILPINKKLHLALLKQHLRDQVNELKELVQFVKNDKKTLQEESEKRSLCLDEERLIHKIVKDRCRANGIAIENDTLDDCEELMDDNSNATGADDHQIKLEQKIRGLNKLKQVRVPQLGNFLNEFFPAPSDHTIAETANRDCLDFNETTEMISLARIIELLVNRFLANPHDSWVLIKPSMWPPHVELLLRTGIAVRNPSNDSLMRLEKFCD